MGSLMTDTFPKIDDKALLEEGETLAPKFNSDGLITAVVQDAGSKEILMLAHMNAEALQKTIETGESHFWSRSRQELWHKGATSGEIQKIEGILIDCDQDAVVLMVDVAGRGACHTGRKSCFYRVISNEDSAVTLGIKG